LINPLIDIKATMTKTCTVGNLGREKTDIHRKSFGIVMSDVKQLSDV